MPHPSRVSGSGMEPKTLRNRAMERTPKSPSSTREEETPKEKHWEVIISQFPIGFMMIYDGYISSNL